MRLARQAAPAPVAGRPRGVAVPVMALLPRAPLAPFVPTAVTVVAARRTLLPLAVADVVGRLVVVVRTAVGVGHVQRRDTGPPAEARLSGPAAAAAALPPLPAEVLVVTGPEVAPPLPIDT